MEASTRTVQFGGVYSLDLPPRWEWAQDDGVLAIYRPDGVGALHLSVVTRETSLESAEAASLRLALSFAKERSWPISEREVRRYHIDGSAATEFQFTESGDSPSYWQVWHVVGDRCTVFVTYTSSADDLTVEAKDRVQIVESLRWS